MHTTTHGGVNYNYSYVNSSDTAWAGINGNMNSNLHTTATTSGTHGVQSGMTFKIESKHKRRHKQKTDTTNSDNIVIV